MKKILLPVILLIAGFTAAKAQTDYCKDITKTVDGTKTFYDTPTPGDKEQQVGMFGFTKDVHLSGNELYFKLGLAVVDDPGLKTDVSITFEDDDVLSFTNLPVSKGNEAPAMRSIVHPRGLGRVYYTLILVTPHQLAKFKTKKIKSYNIFGLKRVPGLGNPKVKIMAYANCIENLGSVAAASDPNTLVTKTVDEMKGLTTYESPQSESIQFTKIIKPSSTFSALTFYIRKSATDDKQQTVYIKFDDGKILNFQAATSVAKESHDDYIYFNSIPLTPDNIKTFKEKKIVKFQVADVDVMVDNPLGVSVNTWVNNLENLK